MAEQALGAENFQKFDSSRQTPQGLFVRYGAAILLLASASLVTFALANLGTHTAQLFVFILAVAVAARFGGFGPGIMAAVAAVLVADFFFIPPVHQFLPSRETFPQFAAFVACVFAGVVLAFPRRRADDSSARRGGVRPAPPQSQVEPIQSAEIRRRAELTAAGDVLASVQQKKILIMGLPGAGKTTLANALVPRLNAVHLNGDEIRANIDKELGFSHEDRLEHARRMGWLSDRIVATGTYAVADFICPTEQTRAAYGDAFVVWVDRIQSGRFEDTNAMFEPPTRCDVRVSAEGPPEYWAEQICEKLVPTFDPKAPTALFVGRYQPFHDGHKALIEEGLRRVGQVCIAVRETHGTDEKNPFDFHTVKQRIEVAMAPYRGRVLIVRLPNVTNVYYGRDVGYKIERLVLDEGTEQISATSIRKLMNG
ncbi:MAG: adenylyl-sulfate kinase [Alphaproteobacteria bacterium]